eukprot:953141-Pyramimonas_sp.AAC.1
MTPTTRSAAQGASTKSPGPDETAVQIGCWCQGLKGSLGELRAPNQARPSRGSEFTVAVILSDMVWRGRTELKSLPWNSHVTTDSRSHCR